MIIELRGVGFKNKGAELMLHAVTKQVSEWSNENIVALPVHIGTYAQREKANTYHLLHHQFYVYKFRLAVSGWPVRYLDADARAANNFVSKRQVNALLDSSGFAYGDIWGASRLRWLRREASRWKRRNVPVVLLPQAFGPFENLDVRTAFIQAADYIDLMFARDQKSYEYVRELLGDSPKVKLAPDFTNLLAGVVPDHFDAASMQVCIIPNCRMFDKNQQLQRSEYVSFLRTCARYALECGAAPFFLIHEGEDDFRLAQDVEKEMRSSIPIVREIDPLAIKGIIGSSQAVISSRFHGLVSALSQGVPSLATGWSHKYQLLLEDYKCSENLISDLLSESELYQKMDTILQEPTRSHIQETLLERSEQQKRLSREMWNDVRKLIGA